MGCTQPPLHEEAQVPRHELGEVSNAKLGCPRPRQPQLQLLRQRRLPLRLDVTSLCEPQNPLALHAANSALLTIGTEASPQQARSLVARNHRDPPTRGTASHGCLHLDRRAQLSVLHTGDVLEAPSDLLRLVGQHGTRNAIYRTATPKIVAPPDESPTPLDEHSSSPLGSGTHGREAPKED
jgi:hypothetical protein